MGVFEVIFLIIFWTWFLSAVIFLRNTFLPNLPLKSSPDFLGLHFETVQFKSTDGVCLEGWKIISNPQGPWIILCHGVGSNRCDLLEIARGLHRAAFNLFLFDFRGHGASAGRVTSFGWNEQRDLEGALVFLGQDTNVTARSYGVYGISMGAAVALTVAARDERLGALALDSPYTNLEETLGRHLKLMFPLVPKFPFLWLVVFTYRLRFGVWPRRISPLESAAQLGSRPLLLIQGGNDLRTPPEGAKNILAKARGPKELWILEGATHLEGFSLNEDSYLKCLTTFFSRSLVC